MKKTLSVLLLLAMLVSLFAGLTLTSNAASYAYNNGKRGQVCTSLTSAAQAYWTGSYSYSSLSAMSGESLRTSLRSKITSNRHTVGYDGLKTYFPYTDCYEGDSSKVLLFYASIPTSSTWDGNANWNREHMWPDSLGGSAMEGDLHSMRPTDPKANSTRSNNKYGNAGSGAKECYTYNNSYHSATLAGYYSSGVFEPLDNAKGDCARVILYDYVVATSMSSPTVTITDIQTLLDWCALDPVDTYEMQRNDIVQTIEGCRNPFVDYPELAWRIFSSYTMPANMQTPSGGGAPAYTITAASNNNTYGTVSVNGCVITASPKAGYYASGYQVTSGTASVTQNGNTFTVTPSTNCTVCINFAAKTAVTVTLNNNGSTSTKSGFAGDEMTLTAPTAPENYTFVGWVSSSVNESTTKPAPVYTTSFTPTASCTLYALFSHVVGSGGGTGKWTLLEDASTLSSGMKVVIASKEKGFTAGNISSEVMSNVTSTFSSDGKTITSLGSNTVQLTVGGSSGAWTFADSQGKLLGATAVKKLAWGSGTTTWSVSVSNGAATIQNGTSNYGRFLYNVNSPRFTTYTSNTSSTMLLPQLYYLDSNTGTTHYTTSTGPACSHSYTSVVTQPTCTAAGYTTYTCSKCGYSYTGNEIAALGHNYGNFTHNANSNPSTHSKTCARCHDVVTENCSFTNTTSGTTVTHTCSVCNYSYQSTLQTFTVSFRVPAGVAPISAETVLEDMAMNLPTAGNVDGYTFAGWVKSTVDPETETAPAILTGSYEPTANVTLYALYTRTEEGTGTGTAGYYPATAVPEVGDNIIIAFKSGETYYALPNGNKSSGASIAAETLTVSNGKATATSTNTFKLITNSGYMGIKSTEAANYLGFNSNKISMNGWGDTKYAAIAAASGGMFTISSANNAPRGLTYSGTNFTVSNSGASPVYIFTYTEGGAGGDTTYYTTNPTGETPHVHDYDSTGVCSCGEKLISIDSAALKLDEDIDVIYNATVPEGATATMTFTMNGASVTVSDDGSHSFLFEGVNPQCMGDNISATLNVTYGGKNYSCTKASYSVKTYCTDMLAKSTTTTKLRKLLSDTLAYGAAAQTYMNYKTNALVTSGVTGTSYSTFTALSGLAPVFTGTAVESPCWIGAGLVLTNNVEMVFRFASPNKTGLSVKVTYNGKTTTFSGTSITAVSGMSGVYEVKLTGIKATDFGQTVTAKFYKSSAQVGDTLGYSVNTYVCAKQADSDANLAALVKALYNYGAAAAAYAK